MRQTKDGIVYKQGDIVLPFESWTKPHRLFTIHEKIIKRTLCRISKQFHELVIKSIGEFGSVENNTAVFMRGF